jgi:hypothetical protein
LPDNDSCKQNLIPPRGEYFVVVLIYEIEIMTQQVQAEKAKQKSETLFSEFLERNAIINLNSGIKPLEIIFTIPLASVMFKGIEKFSTN